MKEDTKGMEKASGVIRTIDEFAVSLQWKKTPGQDQNTMAENRSFVLRRHLQANSFWIDLVSYNAAGVTWLNLVNKETGLKQNDVSRQIACYWD